MLVTYPSQTFGCYNPPMGHCPDPFGNLFQIFSYMYDAIAATTPSIGGILYYSMVLDDGKSA